MRDAAAIYPGAQPTFDLPGEFDFVLIVFRDVSFPFLAIGVHDVYSILVKNRKTECSRILSQKRINLLWVRAGRRESWT